LHHIKVAAGQGLLQGIESNVCSSSSSASSSAPKTLPPHEVDLLYQSLDCELSEVDSSSEVFEMISTAFTNTAKPLQAASLCGFQTPGVPLVSKIFELHRKGEAVRFESLSKKAHSNRKLLWHGTDIAAGAAIVSRGLRILPSSGGRCGRGIYFANEAAKSGYYVRCSPSGDAIMFLADVALGDSFPVVGDSSKAQRFSKAPSGFHSTHAIGRTGPPGSGDVTINARGTRPKLTLATAASVARSHQSAFANDEFVVYDEAQVNLRYLVLLRFSR
jgi:hypothetical protein